MIYLPLNNTSTPWVSNQEKTMIRKATC